MMTDKDKTIKMIVKARFAAMPPNVSFSIGGFGDFSPSQLIHEVDSDSEIGRAAVDMQVNFIRHMPKLLTEFH